MVVVAAEMLNITRRASATVGGIGAPPETGAQEIRDSRRHSVKRLICVNTVLPRRAPACSELPCIMPTETSSEAQLSQSSSILVGRRDTSLHISGGNFNNVEGNSYTILSGCTVYVAGEPGNSGLHISGTPYLASEAHPGSAGGHRSQVVPTRNELSWPCPSTPGPSQDLSTQYSFEEAPPFVEFAIAKSNLRSINQLVIPHADQEGIFRRILPFLADLEATIGFASAAYDACNGRTVLGKVIRASIEHKMTRCNKMLEELHDEIGRLPYRSFPRRVQYAYGVVYEWWTGNEPEEIAAIRTRVSEEAIAIGLWLHYLHS
jgi:hypothetical protein